jgi:hypothetical protein
MNINISLTHKFSRRQTLIWDYLKKFYRPTRSRQLTSSGLLVGKYFLKGLCEQSHIYSLTKKKLVVLLDDTYE